MTLHPELVGFEVAALERPCEERIPGWMTRVRARLIARRLDARVDAGLHALPGSVLAAHRHRLSTRRERADLARCTKLVVRDAAEGPDSLRPRRPVNRTEVLRNSALFDDVRGLLLTERPVNVRGVARLRLLIADSRGPLYRTDAGSLTAALRGVLAAL